MHIGSVDTLTEIIFTSNKYLSLALAHCFAEKEDKSPVADDTDDSPPAKKQRYMYLPSSF